MIKSLRLVSLTLFIWWVAIEQPVANELLRPLEIVYSGNLNGEIEPCGCSENGDLGGLNRRSSLIKKLRKKNPDLVLISTGGLFGGHYASEITINQFILEGMKLIQYDAIGLQWSDLAYGNELITNSQLPWVTSNFPSLPIASSLNITRQASSIIFYSLLDSKPASVNDNSRKDNTSYEVQVFKRAAIEKSKGKLVILSTNKTLDELKQRYSFESIDILLEKSNFERFGEPRLIGNTLVLQPGTKGMYIGDLKLWLNQDSRIEKFEHVSIPMPSSLVDDVDMAQWYQDYNDAIKEDYLKTVTIQKELESGVSPYATEKKCANCHVDEHKIWQSSEHAKAFSSLAKVKKSFDPNCLNCHTLAMGEKGGFIDLSFTKDFINVQCESCHGAAKSHVDSSGEIRPSISFDNSLETKKICVQCHTHDNSPDFDFRSYWNKISH